jgi:hypothetical protein
MCDQRGLSGRHGQDAPEQDPPGSAPDVDLTHRDHRRYRHCRTAPRDRRVRPVAKGITEPFPVPERRIHWHA